MSETLNLKKLQKEIQVDAKALGIPSGAAEAFIDRTLKAVDKNFKTKKIITQDDLERMVTKELKKYHKDLAYVYQNRDKII